jgi:uncharacterized membrane-anchored protein
MSKLRSFAFPLVIALQVLAVLGFAGVREATLRTGQEVILQTVPVDPRDLFRGDYVALRYTISTLNNCYIQEPGSDIYVNLVRRGDVWQADGYEYDAPESGLFIHGKVTGAPSGDRCQVEYGIESYFVPEGTGKTIERSQAPVQVKVSVDAFGNAVIKDVVLGDARPVTTAPDDGLSWAALKEQGETRWRQGEYAAAIEDLTRATNGAVARSDKSAIVATRIQVRVSAGDLDGALADADDSLKNASAGVLREARAYVLLEMGRNDEALVQYQSALRGLRPGAPSWNTAFVGRALALNALGERPAALRDLEVGLPLLPSDGSPYVRELTALGKVAIR